MPEGPLDALQGLRVLDLSDGLAGAYCAKLLGDAGAVVVKAEPPAGHPLRRRSISGSVGKDGDPDGALFRYLAAGHHSVVVDLDTEGGRARVLQLAADSDIVVESFSPGALDGKGLGYEDLRRANPAVVMVSISPFGATGPRRDDTTSDLLLQALSGSLSTQGTLDRSPLAVGGALAEWAPGAYAAAGALAARAAGQHTGEGAHVDVSALECLAVTLVCYPSVRSKLPGGSAGRQPYTMVPSIEPCKDGFVGLTTLTAEQWISFAAMIGRPDLAEDPQLCHGNERNARKDEVLPAIHAWTMERTGAEVVEQAALFRIPSAPVLNGATLHQLEHLAARELFRPNPSGGFPHPRPPFRSSATSPVPVQAAPRLGQSDLPAPMARQRPGSPADGTGRTRPLKGVRVLDLTAFWAGPFATQYLASLGADVIKLESIQRPDPMRFNVSVPMTTDRWYEQSFLYLSANLDKRNITLNLGDPRGKELALGLVAQSDVVIENFSPRVLENFGLTHSEFQAARPDVIVVRMPGWGLTGPWRDRPGFATTMEQVGGMAWVTGYEDGPPIAPGLCDPLAGAHAAFAVLAALEQRQATGRGQQIELAMVDMAANVTAEQTLEYTVYGNLMTRQGNRSYDVAPHGVYRCAGADEWVAIAVTDDQQWSALRTALGTPSWSQDPNLATAEGRRAAADRIDGELTAWCASRTPEDVLAVLRAHRVPAERVVQSPEIDQDPQMQARGFWEVVEHPIVGPITYPGWPVRISSIEGPWHREPAPLLGQHTEEVLRTLLGIGDEELASLREAKVIGDRPLGL